MSAITPESINPLTLPSLPLTERCLLLSVSAIYFCLSESGEVLYIGKSDNIARRWRQHHHYCHLEIRGDVKLGWLLVSERNLLSSLEHALIRYFKPLLNNQIACFGRGYADNSTIMSRVVELRKQLDLTQRQLAAMVGVTETTIRNWENNRSGVKWFERIAKLCEASQCIRDKLFEYKSVERGEVDNCSLHY